VGEESYDQIGIEESIEGSISCQGVISETGDCEEYLNGGSCSCESDADWASICSNSGDGGGWCDCDINNLVQDNISFNLEGNLNLVFSSCSLSELVSCCPKGQTENEVDLIGSSNCDLLEYQDVAEGYHCAQRSGCEVLIGTSHEVVEVEGG